MAITYHAGRRLQGTNVERTTNYGTISIDGSYTVLQFTEGGVFKPTSAFNVEYLVVAGGGSGGRGNGTSSGGGGAGGVIVNTSHAVTSQAYTITVGAGGAALTSEIAQGNDGIDSYFGNVKAFGGGGGSANYIVSTYLAGNAGGSGGGGGVAANLSPKAGGVSTQTSNNGGTGYGFAGGEGSSAWWADGGGGGSGSVGGAGTTASSGTGGAGGSGYTSSISGNSITYAGGGGGGGGYQGGVGGAGGSGGGGSGASDSGLRVGGSATGYGSGGGGAGNYTISTRASGSGSDGIVIIRFLTSGNTYTDTRIPNVQVGSRFEETDTRKMYHRDDIDFKEENGNEATNYRSASWYEQLSGETP